MFTKKALADAANMTVEEITKQLTIQNRLNDATDEQKKLLSDAMDKGLDVTKMNDAQLASKVKELEAQKEIVDQVKDLENQFQSVVAQLGGALMPILEALTPIISFALKPITWAAEGIKLLVDGLKEGKLSAIALVTVLAAMSIKSIIAAIGTIFTAFGAMGPFGIALAGLAVAGFMSQVNKAKQVGDIRMESANEGGKTTISTAEGGIFEPSANDQIAVGPGVLDRLNSKGRVSKGSDLGGGGLGANSGVSALINEMKQLRQDLNSGKIKANTYLDGIKLNTPSGIPAFNANSPNLIAVNGVYSAGFKTTVFPAAKAGAKPQPAIGIGKFHGTITPTTPSGSLNVISTPFATGICFPNNRSGAAE